MYLLMWWTQLWLYIWSVSCIIYPTEPSSHPVLPRSIPVLILEYLHSFYYYYCRWWSQMWWYFPANVNKKSLLLLPTMSSVIMSQLIRATASHYIQAKHNPQKNTHWPRNTHRFLCFLRGDNNRSDTRKQLFGVCLGSLSPLCTHPQWKAAAINKPPHPPTCKGFWSLGGAAGSHNRVSHVSSVCMLGTYTSPHICLCCCVVCVNDVSIDI